MLNKWIAFGVLIAMLTVTQPGMQGVSSVYADPPPPPAPPPPPSPPPPQK